MNGEDLARDPIRRAHIPRHRAAGFTLVELITVVVVVAILAAVAAPRFFNRQSFEERGYFNEVQAALRYAQRLAIAERREVCVALTAASVTLSLNPSTTPGAPCTTTVCLPADASPPPCAIAVPAGLALTMTFPSASFRFNGLGQPTDNAGALLGNQAITLTGMDARTITVWGQTGYVE